MRTVDPTTLAAIAAQNGNVFIRVLTWADLDAYNAAPSAPETIFDCVKYEIRNTSASADIISPDNNYQDANFTVFIIERGIEYLGTEYPIQSGIYFVKTFKETPGRIHIEGSSFPNKKIVLAGDDTYRNVITAFCEEIGKTAVFKEEYAWLDYQFMPTGKQVVLNKAERFENLLLQKYTVQMYERSPKELVFYIASEEQSAWTDIIYTDNQFLAVAASGTNKISTSPDGEGWIKRNAPAYTNAVAYSPTLDLYAAVGNGVCLTSPDGETWTSRTIPPYNWTAVTWTGSKFIATASTGEITTSPDGITWTEISQAWQARSAAEVNQWEGICWSPERGLFAAVAATGTNRVMTSPDGITWTARSAASAKAWTSVCWSAELGLFVAVSRDIGAGAVMTSPDGITWTARTPAEPNAWNSITWSPELSLFAAVANTGTNRIMTSPDGINWTARASTKNLMSVCWSPELGLFAASGNGVTTSPDGITWTDRITTTLLNSICWAPELGLFVAVGPSLCYTSPDGINWTSRTIQAHEWNAVAWSPERSLLVAVANNGQVSTSHNGITWTTDTPTEANVWTDVCWSPERGIFAAISGNGTNRVMTSSKFTLQSPNSIAAGNEIVTVGINTAYKSTDAIRWTSQSIPAGTYNKVIYANSLFVAVGQNKCATSPDGETWTERTIPAGTYNGLAYSPTLDLYAAVGNGVIATSPDGINWTSRTPPGPNNFKAIAWANSLEIFIAVSNDGNYRIASSEDGITWRYLSTNADFSLNYQDGVEFSIIHGLHRVHFLWRDENASTHTYGNTDDPQWNLGYLESTDSPPSIYTDPFYKFALKAAPPRLDITDGDRVHFEPLWTLDPTKAIDASVLIVEKFDIDKSPSWWQEINSNAIFEGTEGGVLPSTIERISSYTPLVTSNFDGILDSTINNLQALAERIDDLVITPLSQEDIQDYVGAMVTGNTETGISVTYDDTNGKLNFTAEVTQSELDAVSASLNAHIADPSDAHDASAISIQDSGGLYAAADVESALQELANKKCTLIMGGHGNGGTVPASSTNYIVPYITGLDTVGRSSPTPLNGTLRNLYLRLASNQPASGSLIAEIYAGPTANIATGIKITIPADATSATYANTVNTYNVNAGDLIHVRIQNNATSPSGIIGGVVFELDVALV